MILRTLPIIVGREKCEIGLKIHFFKFLANFLQNVEPISHQKSVKEGGTLVCRDKLEKFPFYTHGNWPFFWFYSYFTPVPPKKLALPPISKLLF